MRILPNLRNLIGQNEPLTYLEILSQLRLGIITIDYEDVDKNKTIEEHKEKVLSMLSTFPTEKIGIRFVNEGIEYGELKLLEDAHEIKLPKIHRMKLSVNWREHGYSKHKTIPIIPRNINSFPLKTNKIEIKTLSGQYRITKQYQIIKSEPTLTWLHLSDFQFRKEGSQKDKVNYYGREIVHESLLEDVKDYPKRKNLEVDFIIISGDIAFSGQDEEYEIAKVFFNKLLNVLNLSKDRIFIVPGNHDINRNYVKRPILKHLNNRKSISHFLVDNQAKKVHFKKFECYKSFI